MSPLTPEFWEAVEQAGDRPVEIVDPNTNTSYVVVSVDAYRRLLAHHTEEEERREHAAWAQLNRKARAEWASENPY